MLVLIVLVCALPGGYIKLFEEKEMSVRFGDEYSLV